MQIKRSLFLGFAVMIAAVASAQFDGPAPVAWRWMPPSGLVASSGPPLVIGDTVYVGSGGRIYAVNRITGNKIWQFPAEEQISGNFRGAPILAKGVLIGLGDNKIVYGVDPVTGAQKWSYVMPNKAIREPVAADAFVVIEQSDNTLIAIDPLTGQPVWKNEAGDATPYHIGDGLVGQIGAIGSTIFYFTNTYQMHALSAVSEQELWPSPVRFSQLSPFVEPVVAGGMIYVTSGPFLVAVNPSTGSAQWQTNTGFNQISYSPAVSGSGVFVVSDDGDVMVYDPSTGHPNGLMQKPANIGSFPVANPTVIGSKLIIPTTNGAINQFDTVTQTLQWSYIVRPIDENAKPTTRNNNANTRRPGGAGGGPGRWAGWRRRDGTNVN